MEKKKFKKSVKSSDSKSSKNSKGVKFEKSSMNSEMKSNEEKVEAQTTPKEKVEDEKKISTKNVIYIEIDDEITTIFDRIKKVNSKDIYLVVPTRSQLLQSIVNLKILKRKTEDVNKEISIVTSDKTGINLAYQCGLNVYDKIDYGTANAFSKNDNYRLKITPLNATENFISPDKPQRLKKRKISIADIIKKEKKSHIRLISDFLRYRKQKKEQTNKPKLVLISPNKQVLITLAIISIFVFLLISYIALPSSTVKLTPESSILEKKVNVTLADHTRNRVELETHPPHMIASYPVETSAKTTFSHYTANKVTKTKPAQGTITIYNTSNKKWDLMPKTRFQTDEGIVFRSTEFASVPAGTDEEPGVFDAYVTADDLDANGLPIGDRGNIGPSKFFLPALRDSSRQKLYGESTANMLGGETESILEITETDIETAREVAKKEIVKAAKEDLESEIVLLNADREGELSLFDSEKAIEISEPKIIIPDDILGKNIEKFDVYVEADVFGIAFNKEDLANILKSELQLKKSPQKKIVKIYDDDITYEVVEVRDNFSKIKITSTIKGLEMFDIDPDKESGQKIIQKIKEHIIGKSIREAEDYIQNLSEINKVEIKSWPVWSPTIPKLPENIEIEVNEA